MKQSDTPEGSQSSLEQAIESNLKQALDAVDPEVKNYHIRSALQYLFIKESYKGGAQSRTNQPEQVAQSQTDQS
jgi:hypothetical protein